MDRKHNLLLGVMGISLGVSIVADEVFGSETGVFGLAEIVTVVGSLVALGAALFVLGTLVFGSGTAS